ncbi:DUF4136 domain-containing protein [Emticicia sp. CRIBPO]|uniref:DUF4136 domain-containing protein n=1 Tax=Emticicia sp. CRIBPO TaxID=2683258 RepID=UPI0014131A2C|nr:DUF4136 domain-containing protein [Emticicia sp. CRIBPO]NBA84373.1 DUF4136 domain-containing protein [Emticicia sp. CRIBPO]
MKSAVILLLLLTGCSSKHFLIGTTLDERVSGNHLTFNIINADEDTDLSAKENETIREEIKHALQRKGMMYSPAGSDLIVVYKYFEKKTKVIKQNYLYLPEDKIPDLSIKKTMPRSLLMQISDTNNNSVVWGAYATDLPKNLNERQYKSVVNHLIGKLKYDDRTFVFTQTK